MEILSLVLSIVAVAISVYFVVKVARSTEGVKNGSNNMEKSELRDFVVNTVKDSKRIKAFLDASLSKSNSNQNNNPKEVFDDICKKEIADEVIKALMPSIQKTIEETLASVKKVVPDSSPKNETRVVLRKYGFFRTDSFAVSDNPTDYTIFVFDLNPQDPSKASFEVYESQVEKVIEDKNYLEGCCSIEGDGSRLQTIEKGQASFDDGKWKLVKRLKIKFS